MTGEREGIAHDAELVRASDGEQIYTQRWRPLSQMPKAVIVLSHGLGEHSDCYLPFVEYFVPRGAIVYAHDHRGFGRSGGRRGHVERVERYVEDLQRLALRAREENEGLPLVLTAHSMGGTIALLLALRDPELFSCAIFSAPALMVGLPVPGWKRVLASTMDRLYPSYTNRGISDPTFLTRDQELQRATAEDTLRHAQVTARLYTELFERAPRVVYSHAGELRVPFLVMHGTADPLVPVDASKRLYEATPTIERELRVYPDLRHELFREVEREQVFSDAAEWLATRGITLAPA